MKRFVDGVEVELDEGGAKVDPLADRLAVRTTDGMQTAVAVRQGEAVLVSYRGRQYRVEKTIRKMGDAAAASGELRAPMPGAIVDVRVSPGDRVERGDVLVVLEAMKTQQPFIAPFAGVVRQIGVSKGEQVAEGKLLALVIAEESEGAA